MLEDQGFSNSLAQSVGGDRASLQKILLSQYVELKEHIDQRIPSRLKCQMHAEDIIQLMVIQVIQHITDCKADSMVSFRAWITAIADNC